MLIKYYLYFFSSIIIINLIGHFILTLSSVELYKRSKIYSTLFLSQFTGTLCIVILFSMIKTSLQTINVFLIAYPIVLLLIHIKTIKLDLNLFNSYNSNIILRKLMILFLVTSLIFGIQVLLNYNSSLQFVFPHSDNWAYAKLSSIIGYSGTENWWHIGKIFTNFFISPTPYHYFELWLTNFYVNIWGTPSIITFLILYFLMVCNIIFLLLYTHW